MTELEVSNITNTPSLVRPIQARMSEELALRLQVLKSTASAPQASPLGDAFRCKRQFFYFLNFFLFM